jgi:hypothetical protein
MGKQKTPPTSVEVLPNGTRIEFWDKVDADGNEQTRRYMVNGKRFLNVTTVLDVLAKEALLDWTARLAREGKNWRAVRAEAGERGTVSHHLLLQVLTGQGASLADLAPEHRRYGQAGFKFIHQRKPKVIECERMVASCDHRYAGRLDLFAEIDGVKTLVDFKTVTRWAYKKEDGVETDEKYAPFAENLLQLDLYQGARIECGLEPAERGLVVRLGPDGEYEETYVERRVKGRRLVTAGLDPHRGVAILGAYRARAKADAELRKAAGIAFVEGSMDRQIEAATKELVG